MSHNIGGVTNLGQKSMLKSKIISLDDEEGGVGGLNPTLHLVKPLVTMPLSFEFCVIFFMNLKP